MTPPIPLHNPAFQDISRKISEKFPLLSSRLLGFIITALVNPAKASTETGTLSQYSFLCPALRLNLFLVIPENISEISLVSSMLLYAYFSLISSNVCFSPLLYYDSPYPIPQQTKIAILSLYLSNAVSIFSDKF